MMRWVVTGPIGSGKSTVSRLLAERGAVVVDADKLGHEVLDDPQVVIEVCQEFGSLVAPKGAIDRSILGPLAFADQAAMGRLNAITHGRISLLASQRLDLLEKEGKHELAVLEAAVYFLFPSPPAVDLVISVVAEPEVRQGRLLAQRGLTSEQTAARLAAQAELEALWQEADLVLDNSGTLEQLQADVDLLLSKYLHT